MPIQKILIADDDVRLLEAMKTRLAAIGFEVVTTQDSYQALEQARKVKPDVLVLDINMPAGNGFSVQQRVQRCPELGNVPVIYVTGEDPDKVDEIAMAMGAFAVLHKPFESSDLVDTIMDALIPASEIA